MIEANRKKHEPRRVRRELQKQVNKSLYDQEVEKVGQLEKILAAQNKKLERSKRATASLRRSGRDAEPRQLQPVAEAEPEPEPIADPLQDLVKSFYAC